MARYTNMKRKHLLLVSIVGTFITALSFFSHDLSSLCGAEAQRRCWSSFKDIKDIVDPFIFLFPLILLFSLLTYKMREEVFRSWLHFAYWWVPLSIILTLITPDGSGGWGIPNVIDRGFVAFIFAALFTIISLIVIAWKYFAQPAKH